MLQTIQQFSQKGFLFLNYSTSSLSNLDVPKYNTSTQKVHESEVYQTPTPFFIFLSSYEPDQIIVPISKIVINQ